MFFIDNIKNEENARWEVTYYNGEISESTTVDTQIYDCNDICDIILI